MDLAEAPTSEICSRRLFCVEKASSFNRKQSVCFFFFVMRHWRSKNRASRTASNVVGVVSLFTASDVLDLAHSL